MACNTCTICKYLLYVHCTVYTHTLKPVRWWVYIVKYLIEYIGNIENIIFLLLFSNKHTHALKANKIFSFNSFIWYKISYRFCFNWQSQHYIGWIILENINVIRIPVFFLARCKWDGHVWFETQAFRLALIHTALNFSLPALFHPLYLFEWIKAHILWCCAHCTLGTFGFWG